MENKLLSKIFEIQQEVESLTRTGKRGKRGRSRASYLDISGKHLILLLLLVIAGGATLILGYATSYISWIVSASAGILSVLLAILITKKHTTASVLSPLLALSFGVLIGSLSVITTNLYVYTIVKAVSISVGVAITASIVFGRDLLKFDHKYQRLIQCIFVALIGLMLYDLGEFILGAVFSVDFNYISTGIFGVIVDVLILFLVTACLFWDYQQLKGLIDDKLSKEYEWFSAFAIFMTLALMYARIVGLIMFLRSENEYEYYYEDEEEEAQAQAREQEQEQGYARGNQKYSREDYDYCQSLHLASLKVELVSQERIGASNATSFLRLPNSAYIIGD